MTSYAYARTDACVCALTDRHLCGQIIIQILYNEPIGISPSYFSQRENSKFKRCSTLEIHRLLVSLRHIIRRYSVRISELCMGGLPFYGILYFCENSPLICCIFQSHFALSLYRKAVMKFVFRFSFFLFNSRYVMQQTVKLG